MSQFEFFMTFYGLLLGLATAELFGGFASILRERAPPRLGIILPLVGVIALIEIMATFIDAWMSLRGIGINMPQFAVPMLVGLVYFVLGVVMVPRHLDDWPDLDSYFDRRRPWIVGLLLAANLLLMITEITAMVQGHRASDPAELTAYALRNFWLFASYAMLLLSRRRWLDHAAAASVLTFYFVSYIVRPFFG
ncbi:hypothetical protein [Sphingomonas sp.]|jgi:hypothetical protein|uniref:hypothetical protein n=1 Tax=Sphingomonas sp. TaxID=28214 RepID=UPI002EDA28EC